MARPTFLDAENLARQIVDDRDVGGGLVFDNTHLYDFGSSIQRRIFRRMTIDGLADANVLTGDLPVSTTDNHIDWTDGGSGLVLPSDFLLPLTMWEKASGDPTSAYVEMDNTKEILPDVDSADTIRYWAWMGRDGSSSPYIQFIAPTSTRTVRILYQREPPAISNDSDTLYVPGSTDAMATGMIWMACLSRGSDMAAYWKQEFEQDLDDLTRQARKGEQRRPRRRRPYSWMKFIRS